MQLKYFLKLQIIFEIFPEFQFTAAGPHNLCGLRSSVLSPDPGRAGPGSLHRQVTSQSSRWACTERINSETPQSSLLWLFHTVQLYYFLNGCRYGVLA